MKIEIIELIKENATVICLESEDSVYMRFVYPEEEVFDLRYWCIPELQ